MPVRSNAFQRLVRAIQGHLSGTGTVTESRMLRDRHTESAVEVDIVIEEKVGTHSILIGIECTSRKRKATIEWYREMSAKHASLPIAKTVLVSESGFTHEVVIKAKLDNITLMTLSEAHAFKWQALFAKLRDGTIADVLFSLRQVTLRLRSEETPLGNINLNTVVFGTDIEAPLGKLIMDVAAHAGLTKKIMSELGEVLRKTDNFYFAFRFPEKTHVIIDDVQIEVAEVIAVLSIHPRYQSVEWRTLEFNDQVVAAGTFPANFLFPGVAGDSVLTLSQASDDGMKLSLLGPSDKDIQLDVFPHALWSETPSHDFED